MGDKLYLSYGGGVNSTALLLLLEERGEDFETFFVDHGGDFPQTYNYVEMLINRGHQIRTIQARVKDRDLYDHCFYHGTLPDRRSRWCTDKFKIRPMAPLKKGPAFELLGIDAGEPQRVKYSEKKKVITDYPLVRWGIDRQGCVEIIKRHGLPIPPKSGCYFCPFAKRSEVLDVRNNHPDLWCKMLTLENNSIEQRLAANKKPYYLHNKPLLEFVKEDQGDLFDGFRAPCMCGL